MCASGVARGRADSAPTKIAACHAERVERSSRKRIALVEQSISFDAPSEASRDARRRDASLEAPSAMRTAVEAFLFTSWLPGLFSMTLPEVPFLVRQEHAHDCRSCRPGNAPAKTAWAPYLLILPSLIYLAIFFAWPMVRARSGWPCGTRRALLTLREEASAEQQRRRARCRRARRSPYSTARATWLTAENWRRSGAITEIWFRVQGEDP